jgi:hypothetical protein
VLSIHLRRGVGLLSIPALAAVFALHVVARGRPWVHEWLWTFDAHAFSVMLVGPVVAGVAAWDAARWARSSHLAAVARRPGAPLVGSWSAITLVAWAGYGIALGATVAYAAASGAPGWPAARAWSTVLPALAVLALCAAGGAALGWRARRPLIAPVAAVVAFGLLIASYTTLPGLFLQVGGATSSLIGLAPRPALQAAQVLWAASTAALLLQRAGWPSPASGGARAATAVLAVVVAASSVWVLSLGGDRFREVAVRTACDDGSPSVCLVAGYEHLREPLHRRFDPAVAALEASGLAEVQVVTQDPAATGPGVVRLYQRPRDVEDVVASLMPLLALVDCPEGDDPGRFRRWLAVHDWLASIVSGEPVDPSAPPVVRAGGEPARRWVEATVADLRACPS